MSILQSILQEVMDRFMNDSQSRKEMRLDPEGTAESLGAPLTEEDRQALRNIACSLRDQDLNLWVSKWGGVQLTLQ